MAAAPWKAVARCDSIVVDPHKHGLQPYGCGAVLFRDPSRVRYDEIRRVPPHTAAERVTLIDAELDRYAV